MKASMFTSQFQPETGARPSQPLSELTWNMRRKPAWYAVAIPVALTLLMGLVDAKTGWEVSLFIFYALPIILAVWWVGAGAGVFITLLSGAVWVLANASTHPYETRFGYVIALLNREFYFGVVVFAVTAVRNKQDADSARIQMLEEQRQLEQDIVSVSEHEQQRIGRDLHDGLCQQLAAIGCAARALAEELQEQNLPGARDANMIEESVQHAVLEARNLAHGIFPVHVDRSGLATALSDLARMTSRLTGVKIEVREGVDAQVEDPEAAMHLYRIAQEAVANAVRHGHAGQVTISLDLVGGYLELGIEDDGEGMAGARVEKSGAGMGLRTMHYRARELGAILQIQNVPGGGTRVHCRLPVQTQPGDPKDDE